MVGLGVLELNDPLSNREFANSESHVALPDRGALRFHSVQFGSVFSWRKLLLCATKRTRYRKSGSATVAAGSGERPFGSPSHYKSIGSVALASSVHWPS